MSKSAMYAANTNEQAVGNLNFGSIIRKFGCGMNLVSGNVVLNNPGYYNIDTDITFSATAAGTAVISILHNNNAVPGATASVTTAANSTYSVSVPAIVRQFCALPGSITVNVSGLTGTIDNAAISVEKL